VCDPGTEEKRIDLERLDIDRGDALRGQLASFADSVRTRKLEAGSGEDALAALRTALRVIDAMPSVDELA
jgi:predicted dehydrogenase